MPVNNIDYSTMTATSAAKVLSTAASPVMPDRAKGMILTVETDKVRWRDDGTAPTTTEGHLLNNGDVLTFDSWTNGVNWRSVLKAIQFIHVTNDAALKISWYD